MYSSVMSLLGVFNITGNSWIEFKWNHMINPLLVMDNIVFIAWYFFLISTIKYDKGVFTRESNCTEVFWCWIILNHTFIEVVFIVRKFRFNYEGFGLSTAYSSAEPFWEILSLWFLSSVMSTTRMQGCVFANLDLV